MGELTQIVGGDLRYRLGRMPEEKTFNLSSDHKLGSTLRSIYHESLDSSLLLAIWTYRQRRRRGLLTSEGAEATSVILTIGVLLDVHQLKAHPLRFFAHAHRNGICVESQLDTSIEQLLIRNTMLDVFGSNSHSSADLVR